MLDAADDILMMLPFPAFSMAGKNARQVRYIDLTLRSKEKVPIFFFAFEDAAVMNVAGTVEQNVGGSDFDGKIG